jgi:glutathione S-transferase
VFWNLVRTAPEKRNMAEVEENCKKLADCMALVDAQLAKNEYIAGHMFSMGDIPLGVAAFRWFNLPIARPQLGNLDAWYARICRRPAFQKHCMAPLT